MVCWEVTFSWQSQFIFRVMCDFNICNAVQAVSGFIQQSAFEAVL